MAEQNHPTRRRGSEQPQRRSERTKTVSNRKSAREERGAPQWLRAFLAHAALFFATLGKRIRRIRRTCPNSQH